MKRIPKPNNSEIVVQKLKYKKGQAENNAKIRTILEAEQGGFCAYTEYRIDAGRAMDVEHFNENLKSTPHDNYKNWYAVSHRWNNAMKKKHAFNDFKPILMPYADDFEERVFYDAKDGTYDFKKGDTEAENLINFLDLNNHKLVTERKIHIEMLRFNYENSITENTFFDWLHFPDFQQQFIQFRRAMETVFEIQL